MTPIDGCRRRWLGTGWAKAAGRSAAASVTPGAVRGSAGLGDCFFAKDAFKTDLVPLVVAQFLTFRPLRLKLVDDRALEKCEAGIEKEKADNRYHVSERKPCDCKRRQIFPFLNIQKQSQAPPDEK